MPNRNIALAHRLREVLLSGHWIANTNFQAQISDLTLEQATHVVQNLNSIAKLTFHINYYLKGLIQVLQGGSLDIKDKYSFDLPELETEMEWQTLRNEFLMHAELFSKLTEQIPDEKLDQPFVDEKYGTYLRNIEGVIEHAYYHLGQVTLLKKMIITAQ